MSSAISLIFPQNKFWDFMQIVYFWDKKKKKKEKRNAWSINPYFWDDKKNILKCSLLKLFPSMQSVKTKSEVVKWSQISYKRKHQIRKSRRDEYWRQ